MQPRSVPKNDLSISFLCGLLRLADRPKHCQGRADDDEELLKAQVLMPAILAAGLHRHVGNTKDGVKSYRFAPMITGASLNGRVCRRSVWEGSVVIRFVVR
jgi:hypothetical protein